MTDPETDESTGESDGLSRRILVRLLVGGGIGIPLAVEARTLYGMITGTLAGGEDDGGGGGATTGEPDGVGVGEELLADTAPTETVTRAAVEAGDGWTFRLEVEVDNGTGAAYELRIEAVETDGSRIDGTATTGRVPPGESGTLTGRWPVPEGSVPTAVEAVGVTDPDGDADRVAATVPLDNVPVRRGG